MPSLWPLVPFGLAGIIAGSWLFARAPRLAKGTQRQFYGAARPQRQPRDGEPLLGDPLGLRSATWRAWGIAVALFGCVDLVIGLLAR
jgi:hypothetical protein